jgi:hypothetical protein
MASYPIRAEWFGWKDAGGAVADAPPAGWTLVSGDLSVMTSHLPISDPQFAPVPGVGQRWTPEMPNAHPAGTPGSNILYVRVFAGEPNATFSNQTDEGSDGDWIDVSNTDLPADCVVIAYIGADPKITPVMIRWGSTIHLEPSPAP